MPEAASIRGLAVTAFPFEPERHEASLRAVVLELRHLRSISARDYDAAVRRHPRSDGRVFSKSEVVRALRWFAERDGTPVDSGLIRRLRSKPVRTLSGVATVSVLTEPHPCPGQCIFCPSDVRMPKSYLSREPGAQRAAHHDFDPYGQALARLRALHDNGHSVEKVELIVLGGTWSSYSERYQVWFVTRLFEALNDFGSGGGPPRGQAMTTQALVEGEALDGERLGRTYNQIVTARRNDRAAARTDCDWADLARAHRANETAFARCVGLVLETRPDAVSEAEIVRLRRFGATKIQLGVQSLSDDVLRKNRRGHTATATRRAMALLRGAGFKVHVHWMPNLLGSSPSADRADFERLFSDPSIRPDELKIYPCSLVESAELMAFWRRGSWRPYDDDELVDLVMSCLERAPVWVRVTRVVRDIPGDEIVAGSRMTNLRQLAERRLAQEGRTLRDIRSREVRDLVPSSDEVHLDEIRYRGPVGDEVFLQFVTRQGRLAGYLRLSLPDRPPPVAEIASAAVVREVHVYGRVVGWEASSSRASQHGGLGRRLVSEAVRVARHAGFSSLAVISAVGTRGYYRRLGFDDGELYQTRRLAPEI